MVTLHQEGEVQKQYQTSEGLNTRISIHDTYSINKQGFHNWLFIHYDLQPGMRVLELGCGTGEIWKPYLSILPKDIELHLSDFSQGMIDTTKQNLLGNKHIHYSLIDIQDIPFADGTFDVVIANMMLYHVPDLTQACREVKRVLKDDGIFYSATFGQHGICEYIESLFPEYSFVDHTSMTFTLQNGEACLQPYFSNVRKEVYEDALLVTNVDDLIAYVRSLSNFTGLEKVADSVLKERLTAQMQADGLHAPKEYGMFISKK